MQSPLNQFSEIAAAFKENRESLQPIYSPSISNEDAEKQTEGSPSGEPNSETDEEQSSNYDPDENLMDELIIEEIKKHGQKQPPRGVLSKSVLKICSKFTGEDPCRSTIPIKLQVNFIEIAFRHERSPVNLLHIFRTPFPKNTPGGLLLKRRW